jgi:hypothetical protein
MCQLREESGLLEQALMQRKGSIPFSAYFFAIEKGPEPEGTDPQKGV